MKICVVAVADAGNLAIVNILKEFEKRGHIVDIYACVNDENSTRMFLGLKAEIKNINQFTKEIIAQYDIAFCGTEGMLQLIWYDIYIFSYNFITNEWTTMGSDFMFTAIRNQVIKRKEICPIISVGVAKNDTPIGDCTEKQILYIDAGHIPFGHRGKEQVVAMILNICNTYKDYKLVVKPRWLPKNTQSQTHRNSEHIYNILMDKTGGELPQNLILLDRHLDLQMLIDESICVITTSISCYIDVILRGKGVIVVGGLDCEDQYQLRTNVALKQDYDNAMDAKCVVDYRDVTKYLPYGIKVSDEHINKMLSCRLGASGYIVDIIEYIFEKYIKNGLFPKIKEYSLFNYKNELEADSALTMRELKYNRLKNVVIGMSRIFSYIDAKIDVKEWYEELDRMYKSYSFDAKSLKELNLHMEKKWNEILLKHKDVLMEDPINQSYMLKAMYDSELYDDICGILQEKVLCIGPYHYYMGGIHQKKKEVAEALFHYRKYIEDIQQRTYDKYLQDSFSFIAEAYMYILRNYNGNNIDAKSFAEIYLSLYRHNYYKLIKRDILIKTHNCVLSAVRQLEEFDLMIANECLVVYAQNTKALVIDEYNHKIHNVENEKMKLCSSLSYKLGRGITWFPRKVRKAFKVVRANGLKCILDGGMGQVKEKLKQQHIYQIWTVFRKKVLQGYNLYSMVIHEHGNESRLILSGPATGDAYLYGMMFKAYTDRKYFDKKCVFGVFGDSSMKVAQLFLIKNIVAYNMEQFHELYNLSMFSNIVYIDSMHYHIFYRQIAILAYLEGLHNYNFFTESMDFLGIQTRSLLTKPKFDYGNLSIFSESNFRTYRTIMLAPYAKSVKSIPMCFWIQLAARLIQKGFCLCTNSSGEIEPPIYGTTAVFIPYNQSVPFIEKAGAVIGLRSGFMDVISSARCLKISLCNNDNYKRGCCHISDSFSLSLMYEQPKQYDFLYCTENSDDLIKNIVELVMNELQEDIL